MYKKMFNISKKYFTMLTLQEPPNDFIKRFSVMDCIIIKKNREVPERLTGLKINLTFFKPLIFRNILFKKNSDYMIGYVRHKKSFHE
jgi:hypothetical protein